MYLLNHLQIHHHVSQQSTQWGRLELRKRCSLQIRNTNSISFPKPIAPNVWILTSAPQSGIHRNNAHLWKQHLDLSKHRHPSTFFEYHQHTALHHSILIYQYETHEITTNISLNIANLNVINISSPQFGIWQHLEDHWNEIQLHHVTNVPSVSYW